MSILCIHVLIILVGLNNNILSYLMGGLCAGVTTHDIGNWLSANYWEFSEMSVGTYIYHIRS